MPATGKPSVARRSCAELESRALEARSDRPLCRTPCFRRPQPRSRFARLAVEARHAKLADRISAPPQRFDDLQHTLAIVADGKRVAAGTQGCSGALGQL